MTDEEKNVCDECEDGQQQMFCQSCGQKLCIECDKKIHNKGKRILHQRVAIKKIEQQQPEESLQNISPRKESEQSGYTFGGTPNSKKYIIKDQTDFQSISTSNITNNKIKDENSTNLTNNSAEIKQSNSFDNIMKCQNTLHIEERMDQICQNEGEGQKEQQQKMEKQQNHEIDSIGFNNLNLNNNFENSSSVDKQLEKNQCMSQSENYNEEGDQILTPSLMSINNNDQNDNLYQNNYNEQNQMILGQFQLAKPKQQIVNESQHRNSNSEMQISNRNNQVMNNSDIIQSDFSFYDEESQNNSNCSKEFVNNLPIKPIEIPIYQPLKRQERQLDSYQELTEKILFEFADKGDLMVSIDQFRKLFMIQLNQNGCQNSTTQFDIIMKQHENCQIYHITTRKFGDSEPIHYISPQLSTLSIQALVWILKSIRKDEMTPQEKLVLSRIKECYGIKINQSYWNGILLYLKNISDINGDIIFKDKPNIPNLKLKKSMDPLNNSEYFLLYLKDQKEWIASDIGPVAPEDIELWLIFIKFLQEFFSEDNGPNSFKILQQSQKSKHKWTSSVENVHTKNTKKPNIRPPKSISKAIPGGRYGCAQLLKCCGPLPLRECSLGKLSLFVQEAIQREILVYYKTLLIKPSNFDFDEYIKIICGLHQLPQQFFLQNFQNINDEKRNQQQQEKLDKIKASIIEILKENVDGISLAKLPKKISQKINFTFDLHELGFPKLKSLLQILDNVKIEKDGTTFAIAKLVNYDYYQQNQQFEKCDKQSFHSNLLNKTGSDPGKINNDSQGSIGNQEQPYPATYPYNQQTQFNTQIPIQQPQQQQQQQPVRDLSPSSYNKMFRSMKFQSMKFSSIDNNFKPVNYNYRTSSNLDAYSQKVLGILLEIINQNQYGITSQKLNQELNNKLQATFEFSLFNCSNFNEFLFQHLQGFADIQVKMNTYIIYPKNAFCNLLMQQQMNYQQQNINYPQQQQQQQIIQQQQQCMGNQFLQMSQAQKYQQTQQQSQQFALFKHAKMQNQIYYPPQMMNHVTQQQNNIGQYKNSFQNKTSPNRMDAINQSQNSSLITSPIQFKSDSFCNFNNIPNEFNTSISFTNQSLSLNAAERDGINAIQQDAHNTEDIEQIKFIDELLNEPNEKIQSQKHIKQHSMDVNPFSMSNNQIQQAFHFPISQKKNYTPHRKYSPLYFNDLPEINEEPTPNPKPYFVTSEQYNINSMCFKVPHQQIININNINKYVNDEEIKQSGQNVITKKRPKTEQIQQNY